MIFAVLLFLSQCIQLNAQSIGGAKILQQSKSGYTIEVDRGHLAGVKVGMVAKLYAQTGDANYPKLNFIGVAEVVQSGPRKSYWHFKERDQSGNIEVGDQVKFTTMKRTIRGRDFKLKTSKVILPGNKSVVQYMRQEEVGMPPELVYRAKDYLAEGEKHETHLSREQHLDARRFEIWKRRHGLDYVDDYISQVKAYEAEASGSKINPAEIKLREQKKIFNSTIQGVKDKVENLTYGVEGLYRDQRKDTDIKDVTDRVQLENHYERRRRLVRESRHVEPFAKEKVAVEGTRWSKSFNDEELREFFINSGMEREARRQSRMRSLKSSSEVIFRASSHTQNYTTLEDDDNQGTGYSIGIGYEYHLSRTSESVVNWTIDAFAEWAVRFYDLGGVNGKFDEGSYMANLNYYFWGRPDQLRKYLWYVGLGMRRGTATVTSPSLKQNYDYEIVGLPNMQLGLKYRFSAGDEKEDGLNVGAGMNFLVQSEITRFAVDEDLKDDIHGSFSVNNIKVSAGLSLFF